MVPVTKVFLDANWYIDLALRQPKKAKLLDGKQVFYSPLSTHILFYVYGLTTPQPQLDQLHQFLTLVPLNETIFSQTLHGPTSDLEDNLQLHSALSANCNIFLTEDKHLLKLHHFKNLSILSQP